MECKHRVTFQPSGIRAEAQPGRSILDAANGAGEGIESLCGGHGYCGKCKVVVLGNGQEKDARCRRLSDVSDQEHKYLSQKDLEEGVRLACTAQILDGEIVIFVPESSRRGRQVIHKGARELPVDLAPAVRWYHVVVPGPTLEQPRADLERLLGTLEEVYGLKGLETDRPCLLALPRTLEEARGDVSVLVWQGRLLLDVQPGYVERALGAAIDIGTTTVAGYLTDLSSGRILAADSVMNPQVARGEDVMARLTYVRSRADGLRELQAMIVRALNELVGQLCLKASADARQVLDAVIVGNTVMHHLVAGLDPRKLAVVPFTPAVNTSLDIRARDVGLEFHPAARVHLLPIEAGFVGADNVAVLIAEQPHRSDEVLLIIDVGTNGEIVLGDRRRLVSASCACGPAFEGAHIRHGMRAMEGAVEKIRVRPGDLEVTYQVIGASGWFSAQQPCPVKVRGICGSGVIDAVAQLVEAGVVLSSGRFRSGPCPGLIPAEGPEREFLIVPGVQTATGQPVTVAASDLRAVQSGKAAIRAASHILMARLGITRPDHIILAGSFGMHLDVWSVLRIGMVPLLPMDRVHAVGNSAGDGARLALLSLGKRAEAESVARQVEYLELSSHPAFNDEFVDCIPFPSAGS